MTYPPAPWDLHGQVWLSLFRVRRGDHPEREPGLYGAAMVSYEPPGQLTYSELLVARRTGPAKGRRGGLVEWLLRPCVEITDIWVDSAASREGGRDLWAIPKELCELERTTTGERVQHTAWCAMLDGSPIATARFKDVAVPVPRVPFRGSTRQQRAPDTTAADAEVVADVVGSAKVFPTRASWDFDDSGPLGWLSGKRALASLRLTDFSLSFG